jgi:hypothetical protein
MTGETKNKNSTTVAPKATHAAICALAYGGLIPFRLREVVISVC